MLMVTMACGVLMMLAVFGERPRSGASSFVQKHPLAMWLYPFAVGAVYAALALMLGRGTARELATLVAYFLLPTICFAVARRFDANERAAALWDLAAILLIWLPVELHIVPKNWLSAGGPENHLTEITAIIYALIIFSGWRRQDLFARWSVNRGDLLAVFTAVAVLFAIVIPLGIALDFLKFGLWGKLAHGLWVAPVTFFGILLAVAIPEELLFRGLLQNTLLKLLPARAALLLTAFTFGLAHLENQTRSGGLIHTFPNWRYVILATIAGLACGIVYYRRRSLLAAALVHASVDTIWVLFLRG